MQSAFFICAFSLFLPPSPFLPLWPIGSEETVWGKTYSRLPGVLPWLRKGDPWPSPSYMTWHTAFHLSCFSAREPSAYFLHLSVVTTHVFCFAVFYWSERCVLTVLQNVKAGLWGCFSCVLWQDNLSAPLRRSAHYPHTPTTHAADAIALNVTVWKRRTSVRAHN